MSIDKIFIPEFDKSDCLKGVVFLSNNTSIMTIAKNRVSSIIKVDSSFLGSFSEVNPGFYKNVAIGSYTSLAEGVKIIPQNQHTDSSCFTQSACQISGLSPIYANFKKQKTDYSFPHTIIGHDVWLGGNVQVQAGTIIGHGAIIGAGAVVKHHVPPYAIVVGNPARLLRMRFAESVVERLLKSQWFKYDWQNIELPWGEFNPCLDLMEQHLANNNVPLLGHGYWFTSKERGDGFDTSVFNIDEGHWTLEEYLQERYGTQDMAELFSRPEIKEHALV